ncbi:hypothetical protein LTR22_024197 [Elasticomyces elasticus]|nr:hypothetical protein LTR22_024197 [Elasticomyces elasticus]KAK4909855.1 hypothetical protein LTR49_021395 [Elasticomyces elasticus]
MLGPNFYYLQEDLLYRYCKKHDVSWNVICPVSIPDCGLREHQTITSEALKFGALPQPASAAMNALHPLAVYAAVQAHKDEKLEYPGDFLAWVGVTEHSTAMLTGYLSEWAVLGDKCANNKFNASDTCPLPNNRLWPELARWYGCQGYGGPELDESKLNAIDPGNGPTPIGYSPPRKPRYAWTFSEWAQKAENSEAWKQIMEKHNVMHNSFDDIEAHFAFGDFVAWGPTPPLSIWTDPKSTIQDSLGNCDIEVESIQEAR